MTDFERYAIKVRRLICKMFIAHKDGHVGGSFSIVETISVLFFKYLKDTLIKEDWFVLSKGHAGPAYYAALALNGFIPMDQMTTLNDNGTILPSHPDRNRTPGVQCSTGSLGQGISQAVGIAYGLKIQNKKGHVYCIVGDGELNEGQTYEALEFAGNKKLDNLIIFIDNNKKQVDGYTKNVSCKYDFEKLFLALDLNVVSIDGHNCELIDSTIEKIINSNSNKASVIVLDTIKGYGIEYFSKMENCHHLDFDKKQIQVMNDFLESTKGV